MLQWWTLRLVESQLRVNMAVVFGAFAGDALTGVGLRGCVIATSWVDGSLDVASSTIGRASLLEWRPPCGRCLLSCLACGLFSRLHTKSRPSTATIQKRPLMCLCPLLVGDSPYQRSGGCGARFPGLPGFCVEASSNDDTCCGYCWSSCPDRLRSSIHLRC